MKKVLYLRLISLVVLLSATMQVAANDLIQKKVVYNFCRVVNEGLESYDSDAGEYKCDWYHISGYHYWSDMASAVGAHCYWNANINICSKLTFPSVIKKVTIKAGAWSDVSTALSVNGNEQYLNTINSNQYCGIESNIKFDDYVFEDVSTSGYNGRLIIDYILRGEADIFIRSIILEYEEGATASAQSSSVSYRFDSETKTASVAYRNNTGTLGSDYYGDIVIPEEVIHDGEAYTVTGIDDYAFNSCSKLTSIVLPNSLKTIGKYAFRQCSSLTSIVIPSNVESIGQYAFMNCSNVVSVTLPEGLTSIGRDAFNGCNGLTSLTIPSTVTKIGCGTWCYCSNLTDVYCLPVKVPMDYSYYDGETYTNVNLHVPAESMEDYKRAVSSTPYREIVPGTTTYIVFADEAMKAVCVKNWDKDGDGELSYEESYKVTDLGDAFQNNKEITSFDELHFFRNLTTIGNDAFIGCSSLTTVNFPKGVTSIGDNVFNGCSSLTTVVFPESVTSIGAYAFQDCSSLTTMTILKGITEIGNGAFSGCSALTTLKVEDGNTVYDSRDNCNAIIRTADNVLLAGCVKTVIPSSVTAIGNYAFSGCIGLNIVRIPNSIASIGPYAFKNCSKMKIVYCYAEEVPETGSDVFDGTPIDAATLYVPNADSYKAATTWKDFKAIEDVTSPIQFADAKAKALCVGKWDTDGDGELSYGEAAAVTDIGNINKGSVFICASISSFDELQYFTGLKEIGYATFNGCQLTSVIIPEGMTSISNSAFQACHALVSVTIPSSVTFIESGAFSYCDKLAKFYSYAETPPTANGSFTIASIGTVANASIGTATLYVPEGSIEAYKAVEPWNQFRKIVAIGSVEVVPYAAYNDGTLTFYYDENKESRGGYDIGPFNSSDEERWGGHIEDITTVVFEASFANVTTLTSTKLWFKGFKNLTTINGIEHLNTENVTSMDYMFYECTSLTSLDVSHFNTSNVTDMRYMFYGCSGLHFIYCDDTWNATINSNNMFANCNSLTIYSSKNANDANYAKSITDGGYFTPSSEIGKDIDYKEPYAVYNDGTLTFYYDENKESRGGGYRIYDSDWRSHASDITTVEFDASFADCSLIFSTAHWFDNCKKLIAIDGIEYLNTSNVTDMLAMFADCNSLTSLDVSHFNTGKVTKMTGMFRNCYYLTSLDVSHFDTRNVTDMSYMFLNCCGLTSLDVSHFDTRNVTYMGDMFNACFGLKSLDVSNFDTGNVTDMSHMFWGCSSLNEIYCDNTWNADGRKWTDMFTGCTGLKGYSDDNANDATFAKPIADGGYFTPCIEKAKPINEETTIIPSDKAKPGKTVITDDGLVISLGESDTVDKENGSVMVTTVMTPDELKGLLEQTKPNEPKFYNKFRGMYSMLAAGRGRMEITLQTLGNYDFIVMQGTDKVARYKQDEKGTITVEYNMANNEWVFFFPSVSAAARAKMGREAVEGGLKIYSIRIIPEEIIPGDANGDGVVNAADIVEVVNYIMNHPSEKYNDKAADANGDGVVNAADIVAIVNIIMGKTE